MPATNVHVEGRAHRGPGRGQVAQPDVLLEERSVAAGGDRARGLVADADRIPVPGDAAVHHLETHELACRALLLLRFQNAAADEIPLALIQGNDPAQSR